MSNLTLENIIDGRFFGTFAFHIHKSPGLRLFAFCRNIICINQFDLIKLTAVLEKKRIVD